MAARVGVRHVTAGQTRNENSGQGAASPGAAGIEGLVKAREQARRATRGDLWQGWDRTDLAGKVGVGVEYCVETRPARPDPARTNMVRTGMAGISRTGQAGLFLELHDEAGKSDMGRLCLAQLGTARQASSGLNSIGKMWLDQAGAPWEVEGKTGHRRRGNAGEERNPRQERPKESHVQAGDARSSRRGRSRHIKTELGLDWRAWEVTARTGTTRPDVAGWDRRDLARTEQTWPDQAGMAWVPKDPDRFVGARQARLRRRVAACPEVA